VLLATVWFANGDTVTAYAPGIRPSPEITTFMQRLTARHRLPTPLELFMQPMNAAQIRRFLAIVDSMGLDSALSEYERSMISRLSAIATGSRAIYSWKGRKHDIEGHLRLALHGSLDPSYRFPDQQDSLFGRGTFGAGLDGALRRLSFYAGVEVWTDYNSTPYGPSSYQPYDGVPYNLYGRAGSSSWRSSDMPRGGLVFVTERLTLETALDHLRMGPAVYSPLALSGQPPPVVYLRGRMDLKLLEYSHLFGLLRSQKDKPKYLYLHRIDIPIRRLFLNIGISEIVTTGSTTDQVVDSTRPVYYPPMERDWEWLYMLPFIPFAFSEHYLGDRDNSALVFDLNLNWPRAMRWYAELYLDDITAPWTIFSDDWGNKWALTAGVQYFGRLLRRDFTATLEYCRVEPWVYTHFYGGSHNLTHYGEPLGAPLGPNSDALRAVCEMAVAPRHSVGITFGNFRKNRNRGGTITDVFQQTKDVGDSTYIPQYPDSWTKTFLGPGTERSTRLGVTYSYRPLGKIWVRAECDGDVAQGHEGIAGRLRFGLAF